MSDPRPFLGERGLEQRKRQRGSASTSAIRFTVELLLEWNRRGIRPDHVRPGGGVQALRQRKPPNTSCDVRARPRALWISCRHATPDQPTHDRAIRTLLVGGFVPVHTVETRALDRPRRWTRTRRRHRPVRPAGGHRGPLPGLGGAPRDDAYSVARHEQLGPASRGRSRAPRASCRAWCRTSRSGGSLSLSTPAAARPDGPRLFGRRCERVGVGPRRPDRVGVIGFSFGAPHGDRYRGRTPSSRSSIAGTVAGFGGYCDIDSTFRFMMTGRVEHATRWGRYRRIRTAAGSSRRELPRSALPEPRADHVDVADGAPRPWPFIRPRSGHRPGIDVYDTADPCAPREAVAPDTPRGRTTCSRRRPGRPTGCRTRPARARALDSPRSARTQVDPLIDPRERLGRRPPPRRTFIHGTHGLA